MRIIILLFLVCNLVLNADSSFSQMKKEKRVALVIVNDTYQGIKPNKARQGKNKINAFLQKRSFKTIYIYNATRDEMVKGLRTFRDSLTKDSIALFYFSGHALQIKGKNYLLPIDTLNDYRDAIKMKVDLHAITNLMGRFTSRKNMVLIDNIDNVKLRKKFKVKKVGLSNVYLPDNTDVIITNKPNAISSYLNKTSLVAGTSNKEGSADFKKFDSSAYVRLSKNTFYFRVPSNKKPVKAKRSVEDVFWLATIKLNTLESYNTYLTRFKKGKYALIAQTSVYGFEKKLKAQRKIDNSLNEKKLQELEKVKKEKQLKKEKQDAIAALEAEKKANAYIEPEMVKINIGTFKMGCSTCGYDNEMPLHFVRIKEAFSMGKYEVTNAQYNIFLLSLNKEIQSSKKKLPVVNVSWNDALAYAAWLSEKTGKNYTLPSEAQWEYVSRAESKTKYFWGNLGSQSDKYAWEQQNAENRLHEVGQKEPNKWGLYDISGNVFEWCMDGYRLDYTKKSHNNNKKVIRGGSYLSKGNDLRISLRISKLANTKTEDIGFRLVLQDDKVLVSSK